MMQKNRFISMQSLFLMGIIALSPAVQAFELPISVQNAQIYVKQRAKFAKVMAQALVRHCWQQPCPHTIIEKKLAQIYAKTVVEPTPAAIQTAVQALHTAIANNTSISIAPEGFYLGASTSAYQIEGGLDETSAAARFYRDKAHLPIAGEAIDFYHRYATDIQQLAEELHINAYRISLAWDRIQPQQGVFDLEAIEFYRDVIRTLLAHGIKPLVVMHHYDVPQWFEDLGGFELAENGRYFKAFCLQVYTALAEELGDCIISMCCAPEGPAFKGYFTGEGTPGEKNNLQKTHTVIANMYHELIDTALAIKKEYAHLHRTQPHLQQPSIGIQVNIVLLDPHSDSQTTWHNRLNTSLGCAMADYIQSGGTFNFLVNGEYCMYTPDADFMKVARGINVYRYHPRAHTALDWIGVNIYSNRFLNGSDQITGKNLIEQDPERYTDNANYRNYPEGIYRAVQMVSDNVAVPLGKLKNKNGQPLPIIVTENGIATKDHAKRTRYFQKALATITQLITEGYPVIGYLPWTSHDNYEWPTHDNPQGFNSKNYGFFAVNFDKNSPNYLQRTLKDGSRYYADFAKEFYKTT